MRDLNSAFVCDSVNSYKYRPYPYYEYLDYASKGQKVVTVPLSLVSKFNEA